MNTNAVVACAIVTAYHQRSWCPDTDIDEVVQDFPEITRLAYANLAWMGIDSAVIFDHTIAEAIWGLDPDQYQEIFQ
jgi:hypothetical protein